MNRKIKFLRWAVPVPVALVLALTLVVGVALAVLLWVRVESDMVVSQARLELEVSGFPITFPDKLYPQEWVDSGTFQLSVPTSSEDDVDVYVNAVLAVEDWPGIGEGSGPYAIRLYQVGVSPPDILEWEVNLQEIVPGVGATCAFMHLQAIGWDTSSHVYYFQIMTTKSEPPFLTGGAIKWVFAGVPYDVGGGVPPPDCSGALEGEVWPAGDSNY